MQVSRALLPLAIVAVLTACGETVTSSAVAPAAEKLLWSDEFNGPGPLPDPANWTYDIGGGGWGNHELETYCAPTTAKPPCNPSLPNTSVQADGYLHITARRDASGKWTSGRLLTQDLQAFQYGRIEARIRIPAGPGVWPAFWMLGADIRSNPWPDCGELDIMENIGKEPSDIHGSVHGTGFTGVPLGVQYHLPSQEPISAAFHTFGLLWSPGRIQYYIDDPTHPYATFTPVDLPRGATWPFDGRRFFILLNLAMGGDWPGPPTASTPATPEMLVDYVRVYGSTSTPKP